MHGCGGHAWLWVACMVVGGHVWLVVGGMHGIQRDTVNEWVVRILLECILVTSVFYLAVQRVYHVKIYFGLMLNP